LDPALQYALLLIGKRLLRKGGRHALRLVAVRDALIEQAGCSVPRHNHAAGRTRGEDSLACVEPQASHARSLVRSMAVEAVFRQDGTDFTLKIDRPLLRRERHKRD